MELQQTKQKTMELATRLETGILLAAETQWLIKTCLELITKQEELANKILLEAKRDKLVEEVRCFLIDLHRGKRNLEDNLKAINNSMLFLEGRDYIENGQTPKLS